MYIYKLENTKIEVCRVSGGGVTHGGLGAPGASSFTNSSLTWHTHRSANFETFFFTILKPIYLLQFLRLNRFGLRYWNKKAQFYKFHFGHFLKFK